MAGKDKAKVLIVDDDPIVAESLAGLLGESGYRTATAGGASEALELMAAAQAKGEGFGIVVTDVHMPRGGGFDLLRGLREEHGDAHGGRAAHGVEHGRADPVVDHRPRRLHPLRLGDVGRADAFPRGGRARLFGQRDIRCA